MTHPIIPPPLSPSPRDITAARKGCEDTQKLAAERVGVSWRTWQDWERGINPMPGAVWHYYLIMTGQVMNFLDRKYINAHLRIDANT